MSSGRADVRSAYRSWSAFFPRVACHRSGVPHGPSRALRTGRGRSPARRGAPARFGRCGGACGRDRLDDRPRNRHLCDACRGRAGPAGRGRAGGHPGRGRAGGHPGRGRAGGHPGRGRAGGHPGRGRAGGHPGRGRAGPRARGLRRPAGSPGRCGCGGGIPTRARWLPAVRNRRLSARAVRTVPDEPGGRTARLSPDRPVRRPLRPSELNRLLLHPGPGRRRPRPWVAAPRRPARSRCRRHAGW